nr:hypothetical protein [Saprospiraceae bacterium]
MLLKLYQQFNFSPVRLTIVEKFHQIPACLNKSRSPGLLSTVIAVISICFIFYSCEEAPDVGEEVYPYAPPSALYCPEGQGAYDSLSVLTYDDGSLFSVSFFKEQHRNGVEVFFHKNGQLLSKRFYCMGEVIGKYSKFYKDGELQSSGNHFRGAMSGIWRYYYPNGQIREIVNFRDNDEFGPFEEYYDTGIPKAIGYYIEPDREQGLLTLFNEDGTIKRIMECNNGVCRTISN